MLLTTQVRYRSTRVLAYPSYAWKQLAWNKKIPASRPRQLAHHFFGPRNFKGEYRANRYAQVPRNHVPNYIDPQGERGNACGESERPRPTGRRALQPFPLNPFTVTNHVIDEALQQEIVQRTAAGEPLQQLAVKYGIKIQRLEAVLRLAEIRSEMEAAGKIKPDMRQLGRTLTGMFPLITKQLAVEGRGSKRENLTEVPVNNATQFGRFVTIAESEPYGPADAAEDFGVEAAKDTLQALVSGGEKSFMEKVHMTGLGRKEEPVRIGEVRAGEKKVWRFFDGVAGEVGLRYGRGPRDKRPGRAVGFKRDGTKVYV